MAGVKVTERVNEIEYAIRDIIVHAAEVAKTGKRMFYLNIGDPVAFDFRTPPHVRHALAEAVEEGANNYSPSEGLPELRQAIAEKEKRVNGVNISADDVVVTEGISEGIQMVLAALIDQGDEVLLPGPAYPPYLSYARFFGGKPVTYETVEEDGWQPNIDDLKRKISRKTRVLAIINPNNPTGAFYGRKVVKEMLDIAAENDLLVLSDEIYDQITYTPDFVSTAHLAGDMPVVGLNGFSKVHLMTGWRLGYVYFHDPKGQLTALKQGIQKEGRIRICANTPVQRAGVAALNGPQDHVKNLVSKLRERRDYAWKRLNEIDGLSCTKPEAAFYVFPKIRDIGKRWKTDMEFALDLLKETGVVSVNGSGFDPTYGKGHVRAVFLPPIATLDEAFSEVERFMKKK